VILVLPQGNRVVGHEFTARSSLIAILGKQVFSTTKLRFGGVLIPVS